MTGELHTGWGSVLRVRVGRRRRLRNVHDTALHARSLSTWKYILGLVLCAFCVTVAGCTVNSGQRPCALAWRSIFVTVHLCLHQHARLQPAWAARISTGTEVETRVCTLFEVWRPCSSIPPGVGVAARKISP